MKATKRLLALVLCLAMLMGLCTTAFATVASEAAEAGEKIVWLVENGYVAGYPDDTLKLDQSITRAEFSKIEAYAINGEEPTAYANLANAFSDVAATDWFASVVNFCFQQGAVAGYGDGTFKPNNDVTGVEAAKMILCGVLGYDAEACGFVNTEKWALNVFTAADEAGLFEGVSEEFDASKAASRGDCFTMLYNALFYEVPSYEGYGLAYVKDYDVAVLNLSGIGTSDKPFECTVPYGVYTADSFKAVNPGATIELYEYVYPNTTTTKGVLEQVDSVYLNEDGEEYFFVKVIDADGTETWYLFNACAANEFSTFKAAVVVANEYASLLPGEDTDKDLQKPGETVVQIGKDL